MAKVDGACKCISIQPVNRLVRVDGMPLCQLIVRDSVTWLRFRDHSVGRNRQRGCEFIDVPLHELVRVLTGE